jgi:lysyl-tRNA synthetase class 2
MSRVLRKGWLVHPFFARSADWKVAFLDEQHDPLVEQRIKKLKDLRDSGINPYPYRFDRTHMASEIQRNFEALEGKEVRAAGRLLTMRIMGKASFSHLLDQSGRVQIYVRRDLVGEDQYALFKSFDTGDFLGVTGKPFITRTGEITIEVEKLQLLAKALRPLPEKWHGLTDVEKRYRQRYLDLISNEEVRRIFRTRSRIIDGIRRYLVERDFLEVETPILQPIHGGAAARPFVTHHNALDRDLYLRIALELYLKRCVIGGFERVFEIGRNFRNEGISTRHNPEFTMMELYQAYADYNDIMALVEQMVSGVAEQVLGTHKIEFGDSVIDLRPPWPRIKMRDAIRIESGIDHEDYPTAEALYDAMWGIGMRPEPGSSRAKLIDALLSSFVEPKLIQPAFLVDYPVEMSPLAKRKRDDPSVVERFEAFIGGIEIANAFSELNDPLEQRERFAQQLAARAAGDEETQPMDEDFLLALEHGMPPTGGLGVGIDRLVMLFTGNVSIREVILFPQLRTRE